MAFNKRTWKGRQGTGLNKFSINGATPVTVINQPDSVTEQGDALSAGNLNDLEQRIYDAFDDIADGTQIVGKATADASGNVITTTYATKADASDLKSAIQGNSQRIENLEVAVSGSLVATNTDATQKNTKSITSANTILPWALLNRVGARAVAWNQLGKILSDGVQSLDSGHITITRSLANGSVRIQSDGSNSATDGLSLYGGTSFGTAISKGHKYFAYLGSSAITGLSEKLYVSPQQSWTDSTAVIGGSALTDAIVDVPTDKSYAYAYWYLSISANITVDVTLYPMLFDMTANGEYDSGKTDAQNIAKFRAKYPASYYAPDTGHIIPLNPSAFKVVGKNKVDETTMARKTPSLGDNNNWIIWTKHIRLEPNTTYYFKCNNFNLSVYTFKIDYFDSDGNRLTDEQEGVNYINPQNGFTITTGNNTYSSATIGFYHSASIASYTPTEVMFCLDSVTDKTYEAYKETTIDTSFTSDYKYVNENCHDYSENVLVNGVMRREEHKGIVGSYTFTGNEGYGAEYTNSTGIYRMKIAFNVGAKECLNASPANILFPLYKTISANESYNLNGGTGIALLYTGLYLYVYDPNYSSNDATTIQNFKNHVLGHTIYFELATPSTPTLHDPIPNIPCEDGTTVQAVTPQTDLVNAIDVPSTIAYMTKIGG